MLVFLDSWDHYSAAQGARKWTLFPGGSIVAARTGNGLSAAISDMPSKTFNAEYATLTVGLAYKTTGFNDYIVRFVNAVNNVRFGLAHVGDGRLQFRFVFGLEGETASGPSAFITPLNAWYYVEMQCAIDGGPPAHVVASARVNGAEILTWDHTRATGVAGMKFAGIGMGGPGGGGVAAVIDDLYVTDTEFLGDVKVGVLYPNAPGGSAAWASSATGSAPSYSHPQGSGNRTSTITVTASGSALTGAGSNLVNGAYDNASYIPTGASAGRWLTFDFGAPVMADEITLYREFANDYGTWQWYGSNDGSSWTAVGPAQTAWTASNNAINPLTGNTTAYRYYKFEGVSGSVNQTYNREFEFRIGDPDSANWRQVEEHPADDDASYVSAASVGLKDLYNLDDIDPAFTGAIKGVQALWLVRKSDEGEAAVKGVWKSGATEITQAAGHNYVAPNGFHPSASQYLYNIQTERNSLFTASPWTAAEINALILGITRTL